MDFIQNSITHDAIGNLLHEKCHLKSYHDDIEYYMVLYTLTPIMSPLFIEHLDIVTQNFETKISSVKLPRYYPYHPW